MPILKKFRARLKGEKIMQFVTATESIQAYLLHEFASLKNYDCLDNNAAPNIFFFFLKHKQQGNDK